MEMNSCATVAGAGPKNIGVTTTAGSGAVAEQQFVPADVKDSDAREQQLCAFLCVGCRQIPDGASKEPINRMDTAARWKSLFNMLRGYHNSRYFR
jgi:hypothetical protein